MSVSTDHRVLRGEWVGTLSESYKTIASIVNSSETTLVTVEQLYDSTRLSVRKFADGTINKQVFLKEEGYTANGAFSPDDSRFYLSLKSYGPDSKTPLLIFDTETWTVVETLPYTGTLSLNGTTLLISTLDLENQKYTFQTLDLATKKLGTPFTANEPYASFQALSGNGKAMLTSSIKADYLRYLNLWDLHTQKSTNLDYPKLNTRCYRDPSYPQDAYVKTHALNYDGTQIAVGYEDGRIALLSSKGTQLVNVAGNCQNILSMQFHDQTISFIASYGQSFRTGFWSPQKGIYGVSGLNQYVDSNPGWFFAHTPNSVIVPTYSDSQLYRIGFSGVIWKYQPPQKTLRLNTEVEYQDTETYKIKGQLNIDEQQYPLQGEGKGGTEHIYQQGCIFRCITYPSFGLSAIQEGQLVWGFGASLQGFYFDGGATHYMAQPKLKYTLMLNRP